MRRTFYLTTLILAISACTYAQPQTKIVNPAINMKGYLKVSAEAARYRETRRLTEDEFIKMSAEKGTVVLDARSKQKYDELHIK
ncbi:MAG TPA: hypothetical protein VGQ55_02750, partial [Pyrinomonadaceae bacterium]|nr:hypothetical protein [Pyrinomonadaceae bacterium]